MLIGVHMAAASNRQNVPANRQNDPKTNSRISSISRFCGLRFSGRLAVLKHSNSLLEIQDLFFEMLDMLFEQSLSHSTRCNRDAMTDLGHYFDWLARDRRHINRLRWIIGIVFAADPNRRRSVFETGLGLPIGWLIDNGRSEVLRYNWPERTKRESGAAHEVGLYYRCVSL